VLASGGREGLDAVVLDEDEEGVLHLPRREMDAADNLLQRKRAVTQEAVDHLLRGRDRALGHGIRAARVRRASERNGGRGGSGQLTDTRGPKWSEIMLTARRMPCCDTMAARRRRGGAANVGGGGGRRRR
jgi:hypothetical protein